MRKAGLVWIVCLVFIVGFVYAQVETKPPTEAMKKNVTKPGASPVSGCPSEEACKLWEEFKAKYGQNWQVRWHVNRDSPKEIYGKYVTGRGTITKAEDAEKLAKEFLVNNSDLLKLKISDLKLRKIKSDKRGIWTSDYAQYYQNIPVYQGKARAILSNTSEIYVIINNFYPNISVTTTAKLSQEEAIETARTATTAPETAKPFNVTLTILPKDEDGSLTYYLTWHVQIWATDVFVDAVNGNVVEQFSIVPSSPAPQTPEPTVTTPPETTVTPTLQQQITETPIVTTPQPTKQPGDDEGYLSVNTGIILILILIGVVGFLLLKRRGNQ